MKKKLILTLTIIITIISIVTISFGFGIEDLEGNQTQTEDLKRVGNDVVHVILTIGVIVSVIALIILVIKYMMGSVEEKAEYKKSLMPYIIGAALVFAASSIAQLVYELAIQL